MKAKYYILPVGLLFVTACEKTPDNTPVPSSFPSEITVSAGQKWLDDNPSEALKDFFIFWQAADPKTFEGQPILVVPVYNPGWVMKTAEDADGQNRLEELQSQSLIFYFDDKSTITVSIMAEGKGQDPDKRSIYFFDHRTMRLQSLWQSDSQVLSGYSAFPTGSSPNARISGCATVDKWINHCADKTAKLRYCWEYVGTVTSCSPFIPGELPGTGGGPSGGSPLPGGGAPLPGTGGNGLPGSGINPLIQRPFTISLGQDKLTVLLSQQVSAKLLPLIFEASVNSNISFTREEISYLETFSEQDIDAVIQWIRDKKDIVIEAIENEIRNLKRSFNDDEKRILREYSENNIAIYRLNVLRYGANAYLSARLTRSYFDNDFARNCPSCKGNAFKHALFRIFDARSFGREISRRLGDAHEALENQLSPETNMDKKNNAAGLQIYDTYKNWIADNGFWVNRVGEVMKNGGLVFIIGNQETSSNIDDPSIPGPF